MKAIVTGHTRGLGAAIAENLLERNIPVLGLARSTNDTLDKHPALQQVRLDLADATILSQWLDGGGLSRFAEDDDAVLLVNNAGTVQPVGPLPLQQTAAIAQAISLNVTGPLMMAAALAKLAASNKRVLHVSSGAGSNAYPGWSIYCATKAALDHHARATALDNVPGLRICSLAPGVIDTGMQAEIRASSLEAFPQRARFDALKADGNLSAPQDVAARLVEFLLGDRFGQKPVDDLRAHGG